MKEWKVAVAGLGGSGRIWGYKLYVWSCMGGLGFASVMWIVKSELWIRGMEEEVLWDIVWWIYFGN